MKTSTPLTAWRAVHRQSGTAFQADLFMEILYPRASSPSSSMHLGYSWCCLPGNNEQAKLELSIIIYSLFTIHSIIGTKYKRYSISQWDTASFFLDFFQECYFIEISKVINQYYY